MKLVDIAVSWYRVISGNVTPEQKEMRKRRLAACDVCPHKLQMNAIGELLMNTINKEDSTYYCGLCGCPLAAKVIKEENKCDDNRWPTTQPEVDYF